MCKGSDILPIYCRPPSARRRDSTAAPSREEFQIAEPRNQGPHAVPHLLGGSPPARLGVGP
eukprot:7123499-Pyramimonas_sp.AAC.1